MSAREVLMEATTTAWRPRSVDGAIRTHPAWADLDPEGRQEVYELTSLQRRLEAALDPRALSSTARAVLARIGATVSESAEEEETP